jgi:hypothetical protein
MESSDYNSLSKFFHRLSLGSKIVSELSFDVNQKLFSQKKKKTQFKNNHFFISGLARSGTTALLEILNQSQEFIALTYSDLPFILSPTFNSIVVKNTKKTELKERAHKDGIYVNNESPEALDEVFWKVFLQDNYIKKDRLILNSISDELLEKFKNYIERITYNNGQPKRYLSKNNNLVLRFDSIIKLYPKSTILVTFRDPLQHAISLLNQHLHFSELQKKDPFSLKYMNWLGHHEFGLNQKPFDLGNNEIFNELKNYKKEDINYWLLSWLNYYIYILKKLNSTIVLFDYENFCNEPKIELKKIADKININIETLKLSEFKKNLRTNSNIDQVILNKCYLIHSQLINKK